MVKHSLAIAIIISAIIYAFTNRYEITVGEERGTIYLIQYNKFTGKSCTVPGGIAETFVEVGAAPELCK